MKVLYLDHEAVIFFSEWVDGVHLWCARRDAHVQDCIISETEGYLVGVICGELSI